MKEKNKKMKIQLPENGSFEDANGCVINVVTFDEDLTNEPSKKKKRKAAVCPEVTEDSDTNAATLPAKKVKLDKKNGKEPSPEPIKKKRSKTQLVEDPTTIEVVNGNGHYENGHSGTEENDIGSKKSKSVVEERKGKATSGAFENYRISPTVCERLTGDIKNLI
jgi:regulatory protein YycH of two-component signal transduction system YycFG